MAHAGEKILLCRVGVLRLLPRPFSVLPRQNHFCVHALQFRYLQLEKFQVLKEYVEKHGNHCKGGAVNEGKPAAAHAGNRAIQPLKGEHRHQIPFAVRQIGAVQVVARLPIFQNHGIVFACIHGRHELLNIGSRLPILALKNAGEPVKIIIVDIPLVPDDIAAILSYNKRIHQRTVLIQKEDLAHIFGRKPHHHGKAVASIGHGIFTGNAKHNHTVPAAVHCGRRFALPVPQALQKGLRVVQLHRIAVNHLNFTVGRIQGGAQKLSCPRTILNLLLGAVTRSSVPCRDARDGLRHCQAKLNNRLKVEGHLLIHSGHISGAYLLNRAFTHIVNGYSEEGKHESS